MEQDLVDELLDPSKQPARTPFLLLEMTAREFHGSTPFSSALGRELERK